MFPDASADIAGDADIKAARVAAHDVAPSSVDDHPGKEARSFDSGSAMVMEETAPLARLRSG